VSPGRRTLDFRLPVCLTMTDRLLVTFLSICTPAPALCFRNPGPASVRFWARRQPSVKTTARLPELDPDDAIPARSGFGTTEQSVFAPSSLIGSI
jgi:hypothetical protein